MIIGIELAEWILTTIVQVQATILGLNLAAISGIVVFLYREGQFHRHVDRHFSEQFPAFKKYILSSFKFGFISIIISLIGLFLLESLDFNFYRIVFCLISMGLLIWSIRLSVSDGKVILNTVLLHVERKM
jgi:hypothetical protein